MYNPSFTSNELKRLINNQDKLRDKTLKDPEERDKVAKLAHTVFRDGFTRLEFDERKIRGKLAYSVNDLPSELVLRKVNENLKKISYAKQSDRRKIIKRIQLLSREGLQFDIYKFELKSF